MQVNNYYKVICELIFLVSQQDGNLLRNSCLLIERDSYWQLSVFQVLSARNLKTEKKSLLSLNSLVQCHLMHLTESLLTELLSVTLHDRNTKLC